VHEKAKWKMHMLLIKGKVRHTQSGTWKMVNNISFLVLIPLLHHPFCAQSSYIRQDAYIFCEYIPGVSSKKEFVL